MTAKLTKILYVEDDQDIADLTTMVLEMVGNFEVKHFSTGQDALDNLAICQPQLILMDVMMPDMDGPETFAKIKESEFGKDIPVIFMTAKAQLHEQQEYLNLGALGVIVKPYEPDILCDRINELWNIK